MTKKASVSQLQVTTVPSPRERMAPKKWPIILLLLPWLLMQRPPSFSSKGHLYPCAAVCGSLPTSGGKAVPPGVPGFQLSEYPPFLLSHSSPPLTFLPGALYFWFSFLLGILGNCDPVPKQFLKLEPPGWKNRVKGILGFGSFLPSYLRRYLKERRHALISSIYNGSPSPEIGI